MVYLGVYKPSLFRHTFYEVVSLLIELFFYMKQEIRIQVLLGKERTKREEKRKEEKGLRTRGRRKMTGEGNKREKKEGSRSKEEEEREGKKR